MHRFFLSTFTFLIFTIIILPSLIVRGLDMSAPAQSPLEEEAVGTIIKVFQVETGELVEMHLEDYIVGVVAAEMPAEFAEEALKAQAVAARTFVMRRLKVYGGQGCEAHPGADICTDPSHCQGWLSAEEQQQKWGLVNYPRLRDKLAGAVDLTAGLVITHGGELIDAPYHSTCGGHTEDAVQVWGQEIPYLVGVPCPYDFASPRYQEEVSYPLTEVAARLGTPVALPAAGGIGSGLDMAILEKSGTGRIIELEAGGKQFTGLEARERLGLKSTNFQWRLEGENLVFKTIGYGHGVGLCQYGANGMAQEGHTFREILQYYYTGVDIENLYE
ncbi:MAG: stage II sporulation protein D [Firmicutes bacterium]|nr:stage II sporulation protein D [Bacillota bacterium]